MRPILPVLPALLCAALSGCFLAPEGTPVSPGDDRDGDGVPAAVDCDDADPATGAGEPEVCDGLDNDCDGLIDERLQVVWFVDGDLDGYGDPDSRTVDCAPPVDAVHVGGDCDDSDPQVHPGATDQCDGLDRNCDGEVIEPNGPWFADADGDGFGDPEVSITGCNPPQGYVEDDSDCDDDSDLVFPGAPELCNGFDDNCDPTDDLLDGDDVSCPVEDCLALQTARPGIGDGLYWIDPAGIGPIQGWCDQTREGGGWTLVYAYTFTNYATFFTTSNAVTPIPSWPQQEPQDSPVSTTAPLSESDFDAMDHNRWAAIGSELFVVSTINDWLVCQEGTGSLTGPSVGDLACTNVMDIAPACSGLAPDQVLQFGYGWGLLGPTSLFYYWDGAGFWNYPTHDPCGTNQPNQLEGVADPRGAIYVR